MIRGVRTRNIWTLKEMSDRCGLPVSTLSKIEHGRLTQTYDKLLQLSQRLNIRMSELFAEDAPATARRSIGDRNRTVRIQTSNYDYTARSTAM